MAYFPMFMNLEHKKFQVFGAGRIASRRIQALLRYGAEVIVTAPHIQNELYQFQARYPERLRIRQRSYQPGEICQPEKMCQPGEIQKEKADYVLAATDDAAVNDAVVRECRCGNIPVNHAGDRKQCDFYFPALIEQDDLVIGMASTEGSHAKTARVSRKLRDWLRQEEL